jgi:hypothetical protein
MKTAYAAVENAIVSRRNAVERNTQKDEVELLYKKSALAYLSLRLREKGFLVLSVAFECGKLHFVFPGTAVMFKAILWHSTETNTQERSSGFSVVKESGQQLQWNMYDLAKQIDVLSKAMVESILPLQSEKPGWEVEQLNLALQEAEFLLDPYTAVSRDQLSAFVAYIKKP